MATLKSPFQQISQVNPGQFVDKAGELWGGSWENPEDLGQWGGEMPGDGNWVDVPSWVGQQNNQPSQPAPQAPPEPTPQIFNTKDTNPGIKAQTPGPQAPPSQPDMSWMALPTTTNNQTPTWDVEGYKNQLLALLNTLGVGGGTFSHLSPQQVSQLVDQFNGQFNAPNGQAGQFFAAGSHGPGSRMTIGLPGGYLAENADGTWGWVERQEGGGNGGGGGTSNSGHLTWQQALDQANQAAGHTLSNTEIDDILRRFNGNTNRPDSVEQSGLDPVLAFLRQNRNTRNMPPPTDNTGGPGGGPNNPFSPPGNTGQDPFSMLLNSGLANIILNGGMPSSDFGRSFLNELADLLNSGGKIPMSEQDRAQRLESIRQPIESGKRTQMRNIESELANRGILDSGELANATGRLEERIAPTWASALQSLAGKDMDNENQRFMSALGLAGNEVGSEQSTLMQALQGGTNRQQMLSNVALQNLEQNRLWNQFIAQFGLDRDKALAELQGGNSSALIAMLELFLKQLGITSGGFV